MKNIRILFILSFCIYNSLLFSQLVNARLSISGTSGEVTLIPTITESRSISSIILTIIPPNGASIISSNGFYGVSSQGGNVFSSTLGSGGIAVSFSSGSPISVLSFVFTGPSLGWSLSSNTTDDEFYIALGGQNRTGSTSTVLPITLKSFIASKLEGNNALLNWSTSSEVDASHFELERSFDLQSWTSIDKQAARGQNGIETSYSFVDQNIIAQRSNDGVCYYRLGMVDLDGTKKKSDIRSINLDPLTETYYQTFPNPAKGVINVQLQVPNTQANMTDLFLMDNTGRLHTKTSVSTNGITKLDVSDLPKGVYHLQVNTGTEMLSKKVILVEN